MIEGGVRDTEEIEALGLPLSAQSITLEPASAGRPAVVATRSTEQKMLPILEETGSLGEPLRFLRI